ncbi:hypothetical protein NX059_001296 [Plenodomus lindquistii]|nr:hypothetical protein NX059_001296 [Plenodomus lindquistii]
MLSTASTPFRFRDLPGEIRNKIYHELLCTFHPHPTGINLGINPFYDLPLARHSINTAILRTNSVVYREAYSVMIKGNQFVKVTSILGLPLRQLLIAKQVHVVSSNKGTVERFKGYVLNMDLGFAQPLELPETGGLQAELLQPCTLMILHRDLDIFCLSLRDGDIEGYTKNLRVSIRVAPVLGEARRTKHSPALQDYFSKTTQASLLAPLRAELRGIKTVKVNGHVDKALAAAATSDMTGDRWSSPDTVLADITAAKEKGTKLFQQRHDDEGSFIWQGTAFDIERMIWSTSWPTLTKKGGERFVSQLAELHFVLHLNVAHVELGVMQGHVKSTKPPVIATQFVDYALNKALLSLKRDHWMLGYKYDPGEKLMAKLQYRSALLLRLHADPTMADRALTYIDAALRLQPGDAAIMKEKENIMAWKQFC